MLPSQKATPAVDRVTQEPGARFSCVDQTLICVNAHDDRLLSTTAVCHSRFIVPWTDHLLRDLLEEIARAGSKASFMIPANKTTLMIAKQSKPSVFIVDDDAAVRNAVKLLIRAFGWQAEDYASAEAFLAAYRPDEPGCLVLDLHMPGMNGVQLQEQLQARGIHIPVVVITAFKDDPLTVRAREAGAVAVLTKPFTQDALLRSIKQALKQAH